ncbi:MAG: hypothetical protein GY943_18350 [Chloroflexi bacterium]|nr:hypothetical protein [Chloroflexota bacterium]
MGGELLIDANKATACEQQMRAAAEISNNLAILQSRQQDMPARQRSMHAVFDQTWTRLSPSEQNALAYLSVFRGVFTFAAAQDVSGADWQLIAALVDKSLLRQHRIVVDGETAVYYDMHELLRQYTAERLAEQTPVAQQQHGYYYAKHLALYAPQLTAGDKVSATLQQMQREIDNIHHAHAESSQIPTFG